MKNKTDRIISKHQNGEIVLLYRARAGKVIQARIKTPHGNWKRISTKTEDQQEALKVAEYNYNGMRYAEDHGYVKLNEEKNNSFKHLAVLTNRRLQTELNKGEGKVSYTDYKIYIKKWFIPFFQDIPINEINTKKLKEFDEWRKKKFGKKN